MARKKSERMVKGSVHQGPWGHMICNFKNGVEWNQLQNANLYWLGINPPKPIKTFNLNVLFQDCSEYSFKLIFIHK